MTDDKSRQISGMIFVIISGMMFGTMPLMAKAAYSLGSNAFSVSFGRFVTGTVFSGIVVLIRYGSLFSISRRQVLYIAFLAVFFSALPCVLYASYRYIDSGLATMLHFTYPVVVTLISALVFRKRIGKATILCVVLCMAGVLLMYNFQGANDATGMILALVSGLIYSIYIVGLEHGGLEGLPVLLITFWLSLFCAVFVFLFNIPTHVLVLDIGWKVWIPYAGLGLIATVIGVPCFQTGVARCGAIRSSLLSTVEPITSLIIGVIVFDENLGLRSLLGIALILVSVCILVLSRKAEQLKV
ncbi:MAG: DMT family transporter [Spirochaetales bacterium]|nr:DMT family transporter [Spirochaetales bacterium]